MDVTKLIQDVMYYRHTNGIQLANDLNTSSQNIYNKFTRNAYKLNDLQNIASALNCSIQISFIANDTGKKFTAD